MLKYTMRNYLSLLRKASSRLTADERAFIARFRLIMKTNPGVAAEL